MLGANANSATITGLSAGANHSFRVRASAGLFSGYSNVASVTTTGGDGGGGGTGGGGSGDGGTGDGGDAGW